MTFNKFDEEEARRIINEIYSEERKEKKKPAKKAEKEDGKQNISSNIYSADNYWTIENVNYNGNSGTYELLKTLLDNGNTKTQEEWVKYTINSKKNNDFFCGDMPLQFAIFEALYNSKDSKEKEEAKSFIKDNMRNHWLTTLSRIQYKPGDKTLDKVIHNYKIPNEGYFKEAMITGPDREIISDDKDALEALVLTNDFKKVKEVLSWINETPTWIWRLNNKPNKLAERVARFYAYSVRADLSCIRDPSGRDSSLGVRAKAQSGNNARI
jgi:hypothetical protein